MSERSVKAHIAGLLDGLEVSTVPSALSMDVELPSVVTPETPLGWVWASGFDETRYAGSHGTGYKQIVYDVAAVIVWDVDPSTANDQSQFDDLLDEVVYTLRTATLQVTLTDEISGRTSNLMNLGESIKVERSEPAALSDQGPLRYVATITTKAFELVTG